MKYRAYLIIIALTLSAGCETQNGRHAFPAPARDSTVFEPAWNPALSKEMYYDKVLGMLTGSAIGDAMGAPTEMWDRRQIDIQLGFVDSLDRLTRGGSAEGPWKTNLPPAGTTDDTRWKYLVGNYLQSKKGPQDSLSAKGFAQFILEQYYAEKGMLNNADRQSPEQIEANVMHMLWLQEWAKVSEPYLKGDLDAYSYALNRFYGGEMACAGMLYAPVIGAYYPSMPEIAYREGYRLGIFDLGYARDITGLTSAYVSAAMTPGIKPESIGLITREVDPLHYFDSRLVGRIAYRIYQEALAISHEAKALSAGEIPGNLRLPKNYKGDVLSLARIQKAYSLLEEHLEDIPFHAAEIHLINLTAIAFSDGNFSTALEFVVNFGRDNDTTGAVTGAILGAYWGASGLPERQVDDILKVNRENLGMDLRKLAQEITENAYRGR